MSIEHIISLVKLATRSSAILTAVGLIILFVFFEIARRTGRTDNFWLNTFCWVGFALFVVSGANLANNIGYQTDVINGHIDYVKAVHIKRRYPHLPAYTRKADEYHYFADHAKDCKGEMHQPKMYQYL